MSIPQKPHLENTIFSLQEIAEVLKQLGDEQLAADVISRLRAKRPRGKRAVSQATLSHMESRHAEILKLYDEGWTQKEISKRLENKGYIGFSIATVKRDFKLLGLSEKGQDDT